MPRKEASLTIIAIATLTGCEGIATAQGKVNSTSLTHNKNQQCVILVNQNLISLIQVNNIYAVFQKQ
jgi:hypothetical protein